MTDGFRAAVLAWLRTQDSEAIAVHDVTCFGSDWAGGTEEGFHESFDVTISYSGDQHRSRTMIVGGERMETLWKFVMNFDPASVRQ